jgi:hypothetical protein
MRSSLAARICRLESIAPPATPVYFRYGHVKSLARDYDGPRHVVVVKSTPTTSPYVEWCELEERRCTPGATDGNFVVCWEAGEFKDIVPDRPR